MAKYDKDDVFRDGIKDVISVNEVIGKESTSQHTVRQAMGQGRIDWIILSGKKYVLYTERTRLFFKNKDATRTPIENKSAEEERAEKGKVSHSDAQKEILSDIGRDDMIRE